MFAGHRDGTSTDTRRQLSAAEFLRRERPRLGVRPPLGRAERGQGVGVDPGATYDADERHTCAGLTTEVVGQARLATALGDAGDLSLGRVSWRS